MIKMFNAPGRYIQGPGALGKASRYTGRSKKVFAVCSSSALREWDSYLRSCFSGVDLVVADFGGRECSKSEISLLAEQAEAEKAEVVVGFGGGKTLDAAKALSFKLGQKYLLIVPTIASCDAPTSADSVIYRDDGTYEEDWYYDRSPDVVLVDTTIIVRAPTRFLVAGMGDALATRYEAEACLLSGARAETGEHPVETAFLLAEACKKIIMDHGLMAVRSAERRLLSPAFEKVVEANILLSGLGFENNGLASAHGIHDGLTVLDQVRGSLHGEIVAFCTIVQIVLEGRPLSEVELLQAFFSQVGLPLTLYDLGIRSNLPESIEEASGAVNFNVAANHPFVVNRENVYDAIMLADSLGRHFRERKSLPG